jgi:hypothetical protein
LISTRAAELAEAIRTMLAERFQIAVRIREVKAGLGYRIYQLQKTGNRHLVDIRAVEVLPASERIEKVSVMAPASLIAYKVIAFYQRCGQPKAGTDWRDIAMLLLAFPNLKSEPETVAMELIKANAGSEIIDVWRDLVQQEIKPMNEDEDF